MQNSCKTKKTFTAVLLALFLVFAFAFTLSACGKKALDKIEVTTPPANVTYVEGEKFNPEGMVVTAYYSDNSNAEVTGYTLRPDANTELDTTYTKVTVYYTEGDITKSADIAITVTAKEAPVKTVSAAVISKLPKIVYKEGETFSVDGMEWTATYSDLSLGTISFTSETEGVTINPSRALTAEDTKVDVTYDGYTLSVPITVMKAQPEITLASVSKLPTKTDYVEGETFSIAGMEITVVYSDLTSDKVVCTAETEGVTFTPSGALKLSDTKVTITYNGFKIPVPVPITVAEPPEIVDYEIVENPDKTEYFEGESFEIDGLVINFIYSDGSEREITFTSETEGVLVYPGEFNDNPNGNPYYQYPDEVEITYKGFDFYVPVSVRYPKITELVITHMPNKTKYMEGEYFETAGLEITIVWEDGYTWAPSISYFTINRNMLTAQDNSVRAYCNEYAYGRTVYVDIPVSVIAITNVTIKSDPAKTEYVKGQSFDPTGMVITVTYSDGNSEDVALVRGLAGLELPENALTADDTQVTISYYGRSIDIDVEILKGVYIEAEDADITSSSYKTPTDAVDKNGRPNASGGKYVSDLNAGDSVAFSFYSDKAGKGDLAFILASKYLKRDNNWTPIEMGACQFNLICEFSVNGVPYEIADSVILPGGSVDNDAEDGRWLWYNWKEVVFENVDFIQGVNEVVLEFIPHNINDCSQSSFNGKFTANVDSLKVTSEECEVDSCAIEYRATNLAVDEAADEAYLVISGRVEYNYLTEEYVADWIKNNAKIELYQAFYEVNTEFKISRVEVDATNKSFAIYAALSGFTGIGYYGVRFDGELLDCDILGGYVDETIATANGRDYAVYGYSDIILDIRYEGGVYFEFEGFNFVEIIEEDGKAVYCLTVTYDSYDLSDDTIEEILKAEYFGLQENADAGKVSNRWKEFEFKALEVTRMGDLFTIKYDISSLEDFCYTSHYRKGYVWNNGYKWQPLDVKLDYSKTEVTEVGNKRYTVISVPGSSSGTNYWGCVGVKVETI